MSAKTLDERVARIEKIFWVVAVLAVIFGISGAWGLSALKTAKSEIDSLQSNLRIIRSFVDKAEAFVDEAKLQIREEKEGQLEDMVPKIRTMAQKEIADQLKGRVAYIEEEKIDRLDTSLGEHPYIHKDFTVSLPVKKGDIVYASYVASTRKSEFYYRIVCVNDLATPLTKITQCVMAAPVRDYRHQWHSISASEVFRVDTNGDLKLAVEFEKGTLTGKVELFGPTLIAFKVASDIP